MLWTLYAFVGGILAVSYNDIVARSIPPTRRSRLLALRFFAGGLLALGVAAIAGRAIGAMPSAMSSSGAMPTRSPSIPQLTGSISRSQT